MPNYIIEATAKTEIRTEVFAKDAKDAEVKALQHFAGFVLDDPIIENIIEKD